MWTNRPGAVPGACKWHVACRFNLGKVFAKVPLDSQSVVRTETDICSWSSFLEYNCTKCIEGGISKLGHK